MNWTSYTDGLSTLFEQGGLVLWAILVVSIYMWILLVERYWFHYKQMPELQDRLYQDWQTRSAKLEALARHCAQTLSLEFELHYTGLVPLQDELDLIQPRPPRRSSESSL